MSIRSWLIPAGMRMVTGVPQRPAYGRKGNPRTATGRFNNPVARLDLPFLVGPIQHVKGHPVFHAAGQVVLLTFYVERAGLSPIRVENFQHGRVANQVLELVKLLLNGGCQGNLRR